MRVTGMYDWDGDTINTMGEEPLRVQERKKVDSMTINYTLNYIDNILNCRQSGYQYVRSCLYFSLNPIWRLLRASLSGAKPAFRRGQQHRS